MGRVPLPGSEFPELPGYTRVGESDLTQRATVFVVLRPRSGKSKRFPVRWTHRVMSREEFAATHGADPQDVALVEGFAREQNLTVEGVYPDQRIVKLSGSLAELSAAFEIELAIYEYEGKQLRGYNGSIHLPEGLAAAAQGVLGLEDRPVLKPPSNGSSSPNSISFLDAPQAYNFPSGADGTGQTVGMVWLAGGFLQSDIDTFFSSLPNNPPSPNIVQVPVNGGTNSPGQLPLWDFEVTLDMEMFAGLAPRATIVAYFSSAPTIEACIVSLFTAIYDSTNNPTIITCMTGGLESPQGIKNNRAQIIEGYCQDAADLGKTVLAASGDAGMTTGVGLPACCPHILGVGGTVLDFPNPDEVVWNNASIQMASGGGVSDLFDVPPWQRGAGVSTSLTNPGRNGRGVPDVAAHADNWNGFLFTDMSQSPPNPRVLPFGGTSASTPLWAALIALINQCTGFNQGFFNPIVYLRLGPQGALYDIIAGSNGTGGVAGYQAGLGWDACTGWGSPNGGVMVSMSGPPTVISVQPPGGPLKGGTQVTITGTRLGGTSSVVFGNAPAMFDPSDPNNTDTQITAVSPVFLSGGIVDVIVMTVAGPSAITSADQFDYTAPVPFVANVVPNSGTLGDVVTITGSGFTGITNIQFDGNDSTAFMADAQNPDAILTAAVPPGSGTVNITVTTPGGTSVSDPGGANQFTYQ